MPTAYDNLEQNKKNALYYATAVCSKNFADIGTIRQTNDPELTLDNTQNSNEPKNTSLTAVIEALSNIKDEKNDITWHIKKNHLVRDGREAKNPPVITPESYYIRYLNHVRGAIALDPTNKDDLTKTAMKNLAELQKTHTNNPNDLDKLESKITQFNTDLAITLTEHGIEDAAKKIKVAKDYAGLEDKHYNITTLSKAKNKGGPEVTIIESEIKTPELTKKQKDMFANLPNEKWFTEMPKWEQGLVKRYFYELSSGTKVIPTQLRSSIPLLRNAYRKVVAIKEEGKEPEIILETSHSGSLSTRTKAKADNAELTRQNIEQLQQFVPGGKVHLNSLMSPINFTDQDAHDNKTLSKAMEATNMEGMEDMDDNKSVTRSITPFNTFRKLLGGGGRDLAESKKILKTIGESLGEHNNAIAEYLITGKKSFLEKANEQAKDNPALQNCIEAKKDIEHLGKWVRRPRFGENVHSRIAANMKLISYAASEGKFGDQAKANVPITHSFCKSGKDRTQMVEMEATKKALDQYLGTEHSEENFKSLLSARSAANLAGTQGGTPGCDYIRPSAAKHGSQSIFGKVQNYFANIIANENKFKVDKVRMRLEGIKQGIASFLKNSKDVRSGESTGYNNRKSKNKRTQL